MRRYSSLLLTLWAVFLFGCGCSDSKQNQAMANLISKFKSECEKHSQTNDRTRTLCDLAERIHERAIQLPRPSRPIPEDLLREALLDLLTNRQAMGAWLDHLQRSNRRPVVYLSLPPLERKEEAALVGKLRRNLTFRLELSDGSIPAVPDARKPAPETPILVRLSADVPMARYGDYVSFRFQVWQAPQTYLGVFFVKGSDLQSVLWCGYIV